MKLKVSIITVLSIGAFMGLVFVMQPLFSISKYPKSATEKVEEAVVTPKKSVTTAKDDMPSTQLQPSSNRSKNTIIVEGEQSKEYSIGGDGRVYFRDELVEGADAASFYAPAFEQGFEFHALDKNHAYFMGRVIPGVDVETYEFLSDQHARDKNSAYFREFPMVGSDPETFEVVVKNYSKDKNTVYYREYPLAHSHPESFEAVSGQYDAKDEFFSYGHNGRMEGDDGIFFVLEDGYAIDDKSAYYWEKPLTDSDPSTLEINASDYHYATDKKHAYYLGRLIEGSEASTFELLEDDYSRDGKHAYLKGVALEGSDGATFELLGYEYAKDKNQVYHEGELFPADAESFEVLNQEYAKDKNKAFFNERVIEGADAASFELVDGRYAKDENGYYMSGQPIDLGLEDLIVLDSQYTKNATNVFYKGEIIVGADPDTFEILEVPRKYSNTITAKNYSKDAYSAYFRGEKIEGSDGNTFKIEDNGMATDKNYVYDKAKRIEGSSGSTFEVIDGYLAKDKAFVYMNTNVVPGSHGDSFEILNGGFCKDKNQAYYKKCGQNGFGEISGCGLEVLEGVNAKSFEALGGYAKDISRVFYLDERIPKADALSFRVEQDEKDRFSDWAVDRSHVYFRGNIVEEADAGTFVTTGVNRGYDKFHQYYYGAIDNQAE